MSRGDDFENVNVEGFKGNLRNSLSPMINIKIKDGNNVPQFKFEFRLDDTSSTIKFLNILRDKFGVTCFKISDHFDAEHKIHTVEEEISALEEWREKTKGLRDDEDFTEKMKKAFSK